MSGSTQRKPARLPLAGGRASAIGDCPKGNSVDRILLVEDSADDAAMIMRMLRQGGFDARYERVESAAAMQAALAGQAWDAVISDYRMPGFTGLDALRILRSGGSDIPFILVSDAIGEELSAQAIQNGADDYLLKDRLSRLASALAQALERKRLRDAARKTAATLLEREAGLRQAQFVARLGHAVTGPDGAFESWSESLPLLAGMDAARFPKSTREWLALLHPEDRERFRAGSIEAAKIKSAVDITYRLRRGDGEWIHLRHVIEPLAGEARGRWFNTVQDITAQKRAEEEQHSARQLLDNIIENIPTAVQLKSVADDYRVVMWNKAAETMYGVPREDAIGRNVHDLWPPADADRFHAADLELVASGRMQDFPDRPARTRDRGEIRVHMRKVVLFDPRGEPTHLLAIADDITARQADEARLRESEARFRSLSELSSDWYWEQDSEYRFAAFSGGDHEGGWGKDQRAAVGLRRWDLPGVQPVSGDWGEHQACLDARKPFRNFEYQRRLGDGSLQYVAASGEPVFDPGGRFTGYRGVATVITERKRKEYELQQFQMAMDTSVDSIYLTDPSTLRFVYLNNTACERLGFTREQLLQMGPQDVLAIGRDEIAREYDEVVAAGDAGVRQERRFVRSDGGEGWTELHRSAKRTGSGTLIVTIGRDITERKRMEREARQAEKRFRSIFDNASDGIFLASREGRLLASNPANARMLGYASPEELIAAVADTGAQLYVDPEDRRRMLELLEAQGSVHGFEARLRRKDGEVVWASLNTRIVSDDTDAALQVLGMSQDITEHKRAQQVLALEHSVARQLADAQSRSEGLQAVIRLLCESEGWEVGRYWQVDTAADVLRFGGSWGAADPAIARFVDESRAVVFAKGTGLAGIVWRSGEPLWSSDTSTDPRVAASALARASGMRGAFVFPVTSDGDTVGVIGISSRQVRPPDERLLAAVRVIGGQVGQFLRRKQGEERIKRLNRVYAVLSGINALLVRVGSRGELFREACRIAVEAGKFALAWIGEVDRAGERIVVKDWFGDAEGYLEKMPLELVGDRALGRGLAGMAVAESNAMIANDIATDPHVRLKAEALARGFKSMAVLPLSVAGEVVAVLALYAEQEGFFDADEMKLLNELGGDISFSLNHIQNREKLDYLALYDSLTGLANRTLFHERLVQHVQSATASAGKLALALVDIERFKMVNDSLGRQAGDALLRQFAERLARAADRSEIARIGADQFALVLPDIKGRSEIGRTLEKIWRSCLETPFLLNETEIRISMKGGIAIHPGDGADAETLFRNAEAAWKKAKRSGERYLFHAPEMTARIAEKLSLENKLRQALEKGEFVLHYQPKVDLESRRVAGVEALIRWQSPELGLVPPGQFIPLMEETGLIREAGSWALRRATLDHGQWLRQGLAAPRIAVNVSAIQLRQRDFVAEVREAIAQGANPTAIDIEITESLLMEDVAGNIRKLSALRELGMKIAIDDFGTGYSSLGYLAKLPVHTLKIDRSFVNSMLNDPDTMTLVQTIITLAHSLRLSVVAEGVEQEEQAKMLRLLRCNEMQGYLFSKPLPYDEMTALLRGSGSSALPEAA